MERGQALAICLHELRRGLSILRNAAADLEGFAQEHIQDVHLQHGPSQRPIHNGGRARLQRGCHHPCGLPSHAVERCRRPLAS